MEHISQLATKIRDTTASPDILVISRSFLPKEAVIGEYLYNRCLQDPEKVIVLAASCRGDKIFDQAQQFPVYRWTNLQYWLGSSLGSYLQPFFNLVASFVLAIKLYFRYHYHYIEWGHGYEFPSLLLLSYILPIRFFIYLHGNDLASAVCNPLWRSLFKLTLNRAEGIVCNSSSTQNYLRDTFRLQTPTHVINPVIRPEKFGLGNNDNKLNELGDGVTATVGNRLRQAYNIPQSAIVILSVGRLIKQKSFERIIENLPLLLTIGVDVHYILCGQGPCESELKSLAERLRVDKRVHFAGYVSNQELASYYAACDIFAMLSLSSTPASSLEGYGIAYLEASYFGKPVIASRHAALIDVVQHEKNGLLVNPKSGYEVFQAFKQLSQNQQLREQFGRQGRELAKRKTLHRSLYKSEVNII